MDRSEHKWTKWNKEDQTDKIGPNGNNHHLCRLTKKKKNILLQKMMLSLTINKSRTIFLNLTQEVTQLDTKESNFIYKPIFPLGANNY